MKIKIIEERENPLLNRRELSFKVFYKAATPPRNEVRDKLIAILNAKKETVIMDSLTSRYGLHEGTGTARVYKSKARAKQVESRFLFNKNLGEKKPEEKAPKEEAAVKAKAKAEKTKAEPSEKEPKEVQKAEKPGKEEKEAAKPEEKK